MTDLTPEQISDYCRLMAEAEGWTNLEFHSSVNICIGNCPDGCRGIGSTDNYSHDLNALARVARIICQTEKGKKLLKTTLYKVWLPVANKISKAIWRECLTPEELFQIIGKVLETLKKK